MLFQLSSQTHYDYENKELFFTFPTELKNRFEAISKPPYIDTLRDAAFAANSKIKLVCDGEEVVVDTFWILYPSSIQVLTPVADEFTFLLKFCRTA